MYFPLEDSVDASKWTHFEDDGSDKGVMKLETEVGGGTAVICRHLCLFLRVTAAAAAAETLDETTCHPPPPMRCYCYRWLIPPSEVLFNSTREILHHSIHDSENILLLCIACRSCGELRMESLFVRVVKCRIASKCHMHVFLRFCSLGTLHPGLQSSYLHSPQKSIASLPHMVDGKMD